MGGHKNFVRDIPRRKFLELGIKGSLITAATPAMNSQLLSCSNGMQATAGLHADKALLDKVIARAMASGGASGLWIENGEIKHPVKGVTIAGSAAAVFGAIDLMASNLDLNRSMASPTFRVAEMQIGGK